MADNTDKNTTTNNTENKDQNQNNNSDSNSSTGKKDTPKPQAEKKETEEEKAARLQKEKEEADRKAAIAAAEKKREEEFILHQEEIAKNVFSGTTSADNIKVGDHIKHINLTLPEMKMTPIGCKVAVGLDNIMTEDIKQEFNTYNYFGIFDSFDDMYVPSYDENGKEIFEGKDTVNAQKAGIKNNGVPNKREKTKDGNYKVKTGSPAVRSLFNRAGQILIGNLNIDKNKNKELYWKAVRNTASEWRVALNVPLMDSPATRKRIREHSGCTIKELVKASKAGDLGRAKYSYADFMYCKYLGRISNNYLITLRRFPTPPGDCITTSGTGKTRSSGRRGTRKAEGESQSVEDMGCMVTWLGTPGNDMNNILKYSVTMPFEEKEAGWEDIQVDGDSSQGFLPSIAAAFNDSYRRQYCAGYGGTAFNSYANKLFGGRLGDGYDAKAFANFRDKNKIYGPVDVVKKIYKRSENGGLDFKQNITIVFDYELRSYNGINPRQAMLDLISNILNVTYTSGGWWGGGYKGGGMAQSSIFTNLNIFKFDGTFTGFCDSLQKDYQTLTANLASQVQSAGGILQYCLKLLNNIGGMLMGGLLNKMGRPARAMMNSLLSEQPVGFWHLMVGNPHHPIMSVGNMILKNTTVEHYGPLGLDDFPTGLKVTCELDRGKPRDNREVEKMYMNGNDRIYSSIGPKVTDMYQKAAAYKAELLSESSAETKGIVKKSKHTSLVNVQQNKNFDEQQLNTIKTETLPELNKIQKDLDKNIKKKKEIDLPAAEKNYKQTYEDAIKFYENIDTKGGIITAIDELKDPETIAREWAEKVVSPKPCMKIFSYKDEIGEVHYTTVMVNVDATKEEKEEWAEEEYDPIHIVVDYELADELKNIINDISEAEICAMITKDYLYLNTENREDVYPESQRQALINMYSTLVATMESSTIADAKKKWDDTINSINEDIEDYNQNTQFIAGANQDIVNLNKSIKEAEELLNLSNRLEEMTANLDSWSGDKIWNGLTANEQGQILSKLADTDWYNLLYNWFGQADLYSISMAAQEIEYGSYKKKDTELKAYNPDKIDTAQASTTMLKKAFNRHDWKEEKTMDVSVTHVDGDGNVHKVYVQVESGEKDTFLNDYKKYLETGDLSLISKYVSANNKDENSLSYSAVNGKEGKLDASQVAVYKQPEPPAQTVVPSDENPGANPGSNVSVGNTDGTNNNIMTPTVLKPGEAVWNPRLATSEYFGSPLYHAKKINKSGDYEKCQTVLSNLVQKKIPNLPKNNPLYKRIANMPPKLLSVAWPSFEAIWKQIIDRNGEITFKKLTSWRWENPRNLKGWTKKAVGGLSYKRHPMGLAVDINSGENGWIKYKSRENKYWPGYTLVYKEHVKTTTCWSKTKNKDTWRKQPGAAIIQAFTDHGWSWGMYSSGPDLMHWNALFKEVYSTSYWDDYGNS